MWQAGNIGGELLNWIVMLGAIGTHKPRYLAEQDDKRRARLCRLALELKGRNMNAYQVNKLCHRIFHDVPFREAVKHDPAAAIADWPFSDDERKALLDGDVKRLYEWGTHPFLLSHFTRWNLFGLNAELYAERIRGAKDPKQ